MRRRLPLLLVLAWCGACRHDPGPALIERHYQPGTEYLTSAVVTTQRSLHRVGEDGEPRPVGREFSQEVRSRQSLRVGADAGGVCPVELELPWYQVSEAGRATRMNLAGCVGQGRYDRAARRLSWTGLRDTTWTAPPLADSVAAVEALTAPEAAAFLASTMGLLQAALQDSTRLLLPGQGFRETSRQETRIGPWPAVWNESRTVTLRTVAGDRALFDVAVDLAPEALPGGPPIRLEGSGAGTIEYDLGRRCTLAKVMATEMTIEVEDSVATWVARSSTRLDIRTEARPLPSPR